MAEDTDTSSEEGSIRNIGRKLSVRRKRNERLALVATLVFVGLVGAVAWYTDGRLFSKPWEAIMSFEEAGKRHPNAAVNCRNPKNKNTVYCQDRQGSVEADWHSISRHHEGKANAFTLHGKR